jgi:hypothetical protein
MNNIRKIAIFMLLVVAVFACKEGDRFDISSDDKIPPAPPVFDSVQPLSGGARIFYQLPADRDLVSIEASFTATNGKLIKSAVSFLAPYLEVFGFGDTLPQTIQLYALDMAGNKSENVNVTFSPLEPAFSKVAKGLTVKPAFGALMIDWENELQQNITVFVDFSFSENGTQRSLRQVYSSRVATERYFINDLAAQVPINVQITVEDLYGNRSETINVEQLIPLADEVLDKSKWVIPDPGVRIGGKVMGCGDTYQGKISNICDGYIDYVPPLGIGGNIVFFYLEWYVGGVNVNAWPWQLFIDLGDKYELSRIVTHQLWSGNSSLNMNPYDLGEFYGGTWNIGTYNMYWWDGNDDATVGEWKLIRQVKIPKPTADMGITDIVRQAVAGDEALMYLDPDYTPATRYFRYEPVTNIINYATGGYTLSELTLYGRKATR